MMRTLLAEFREENHAFSKEITGLKEEMNSFVSKSQDFTDTTSNDANQEGIVKDR